MAETDAARFDDHDYSPHRPVDNRPIVRVKCRSLDEKRKASPHRRECRALSTMSDVRSDFQIQYFATSGGRRDAVRRPRSFISSGLYLASVSPSQNLFIFSSEQPSGSIVSSGCSPKSTFLLRHFHSLEAFFLQFVSKLDTNALSLFGTPLSPRAFDLLICVAVSYLDFQTVVYFTLADAVVLPSRTLSKVWDQNNLFSYPCPIRNLSCRVRGSPFDNG
ncbi:hypothetical protein ACLOJK_031040 [Asimina triloba]